MTVIKRDPIAIGSVGAYTQEVGEQLTSMQTKLKTDIESLKESYQGVDAEIQIAQMLATADKLTSIVQNLEYFGKYMQHVADYDSDNLHTTKQKMNRKLNMPIDNQTSFDNSSLSIDNIINYYGNDGGKA